MQETKWCFAAIYIGKEIYEADFIFGDNFKKRH